MAIYKTPEGAFLKLEGSKITSPSQIELQQIKAGTLTTEAKTYADVFKLSQTPLGTVPPPSPSFFTPIAGVEGPGIPRTGMPPPPLPVTPVSTTPPATDLTLGTVETPELPPDTTIADTKAYTEGILKDLETKKQAVLDAYNQQLKDIQAKKDATQKEIDELLEAQAGVIEDTGPLLAPFREKLETSERERLKVEENYFANQALVNELGTLLTDLQSEVTAAEQVTGLAAIRNPRIAKMKEDVAARVGIIQAVMSARTGQIHEAYTLIDRSIDAIAKDRNDQLTYYKMVYDFYGEQKDAEGKRLIQLTKDEKDFVEKQISFLEGEVKVSQDTVDYIKEKLIDPKTALAMAQAGVTINDSIPQINKKLSDWSYRQEISDSSNAMEKDGYQALITQEQIATKPADEINWQTDSKGVKRAWWKEKKATTLGTKQAEWDAAVDYATQYKDQATPEEIELKLRKDTQYLTDSDIKAIIKGETGKTISRSQLLTASRAMKQEDIENHLRARFTKDELAKMAKDAGFGAWNKSSETETKEYLESPQAREKVSESLAEQYEEQGFTITD